MLQDRVEDLPPVSCTTYRSTHTGNRHAGIVSTRATARGRVHDVVSRMHTTLARQTASAACWRPYLSVSLMRNPVWYPHNGIALSIQEPQVNAFETRLLHLTSLSHGGCCWWPVTLRRSAVCRRFFGADGFGQACMIGEIRSGEPAVSVIRLREEAKRGYTAERYLG